MSQSFSIKHKVYIVQKGAYSKITTPTGKIFINSTGNAYMATAGTGDLLTGIIGGLLAQGYTTLEAVKTGVFIHGMAGDLAGQKLGYHGLSSSDFIPFISEAFNRI